MMEAFNDLDLDHDGMLGKQELHDGLKKKVSILIVILQNITDEQQRT